MTLLRKITAQPARILCADFHRVNRQFHSDMYSKDPFFVRVIDNRLHKKAKENSTTQPELHPAVGAVMEAGKEDRNETTIVVKHRGLIFAGICIVFFNAIVQNKQS
jgi:hypothetical protein